MGTSPVEKGLVRNNARKKLLFILIAIGDPSMVLSWAKSQSKISCTIFTSATRHKC